MTVFKHNAIKAFTKCGNNAPYITHQSFCRKLVTFTLRTISPPNSIDKELHIPVEYKLVEAQGLFEQMVRR
jgi:hypothetical protein